MKSLKPILISALLLITAACGGGGGDSTPAPATTTVAGVAAAGIIKGGTVKVFAPYSSLTGADKKQIGTDVQTSLTTGEYSVNLGTYTGPVIIEVTGGQYEDEATGTLTTIPTSAPLRAVAVSSTGTVNVAVTPLTELAAKQAATLAGAGVKLTDASINQANAQVSDLFKVDIIATSPLDASAPLVGTQAQKDYTLALAAVSQLANDPALLETTLTNLANNITAAGSMDATVVGNIATALSDFVTLNVNNSTGITVVPDTLQNLGTTSFTLTVALTGTGVKGVDAIINLPVGVTISADSTGAPLDGVLTKLTSGTNFSLEGSVATAGTLHVIFNVADQGFTMAAGDILTIKTDVAAGQAAPTASQFTLGSATKVMDANGAVVSGASLSLK